MMCATFAFSDPATAGAVDDAEEEAGLFDAADDDCGRLGGEGLALRGECIRCSASLLPAPPAPRCCPAAVPAARFRAAAAAGGGPKIDSMNSASVRDFVAGVVAEGEAGGGRIGVFPLLDPPDAAAAAAGEAAAASASSRSNLFCTACLSRSSSSSSVPWSLARRWASSRSSAACFRARIARRRARS